MAHFQHGVIDVVDLVADDHLVLAAGLHDLDHAVRGFQYFLVGLGFVLQLKAQAGNAVRHRDNIAFAAHILNNNARKAVIFTSHKSILLLICLVGFLGQFKFQTAIFQAYLCHGRQCGQGVDIRKAFIFERDREPVPSPVGGGNIIRTAQQRVQQTQQVRRLFRNGWHGMPPPFGSGRSSGR